MYVKTLRTDGRLPGPHPDGVLVAFVDGTIDVIPHEVMSAELLRAIVSMDGGEVVVKVTNRF